MTIEAGTTGAGAGNTSTGTAAQSAGNTESEVVKGLNRKINEQNAELAEAKRGSAEAIALKAELAETRADLSKTKKLAAYNDIADFLTDSFDRGLDPEKVDDDFVNKLRTRTRAESTDSGPALNPARGVETPEHESERILRSGSFLN